MIMHIHMHICIDYHTVVWWPHMASENAVNIASDNGLSPVRVWRVRSTATKLNITLTVNIILVIYCIHRKVIEMNMAQKISTFKYGCLGMNNCISHYCSEQLFCHIMYPNNVPFVMNSSSIKPWPTPLRNFARLHKAIIIRLWQSTVLKYPLAITIPFACIFGESWGFTFKCVSTF